MIIYNNSYYIHWVLRSLLISNFKKLKVFSKISSLIYGISFWIVLGVARVKWSLKTNINAIFHLWLLNENLSNNKVVKCRTCRWDTTSLRTITHFHQSILLDNYNVLYRLFPLLLCTQKSVHDLGHFWFNNLTSYIHIYIEYDRYILWFLSHLLRVLCFEIFMR